MHLSRFAEEIVIWCSAPYRFIRLSDAFTTGSSIMPQKRNPDAAELVRAKTGRVNGALVGLLTVMKGLPLAYAKDMQEDKQQVFDAAEAWALCLAATAGMVRDMTPDTARIRAFAGADFATATDLADCLVRVLNCPSAPPTTSPAAWSPAPRPTASTSPASPLADMQRRNRASPKTSSPSSPSMRRSRHAQLRRHRAANVARQAARWLAALA